MEKQTVATTVTHSANAAPLVLNFSLACKAGQARAGQGLAVAVRLESARGICRQRIEGFELHLQIQLSLQPKREEVGRGPGPAL